MSRQRPCPSGDCPDKPVLSLVEVGAMLDEHELDERDDCDDCIEMQLDDANIDDNIDDDIPDIIA